MFRVPVNTVVTRCAVAGLATMAVGLGACGNEDETASGDAGATPSVVATTPEPTQAPDATPKPDGTGDRAPSGQLYKKISKARAAHITDHLETGATVRKTGEATISSDKINAEVDDLIKVLKADGLAARRATEKTDTADETTTTIIAGRVRVLFYPSERKAAVQTRNYQQLVNIRPGYSRVDRVGARVWLYIKPKVLITQADLKKYRSIRDRAERAV